MSTKDDSGPAFPIHVPEVPHAQSGGTEFGMSLRDYFAAISIPGILASRDESGRGGFCEMPAEEIAAAAYKLADSMLAERSK